VAWGAFPFFIAYDAFWLLWAVRGCGDDCVVDVSPLVVTSPMQLIGWGLGVLTARGIVSMRRRRAEAAGGG
jgi:hypothetical protein